MKNCFSVFAQVPLNSVVNSSVVDTILIQLVLITSIQISSQFPLECNGLINSISKNFLFFLLKSVTPNLVACFVFFMEHEEHKTCKTCYHEPHGR